MNGINSTQTAEAKTPTDLLLQGEYGAFNRFLVEEQSKVVQTTINNLNRKKNNGNAAIVGARIKTLNSAFSELKNEAGKLIPGVSKQKTISTVERYFNDLNYLLTLDLV